jgi:hypothetical protein
MLRADQAQELHLARVIRPDDKTVALENVQHGAYAVYKHIDLTGLRSAKTAAFIMPDMNTGGEIELRLDKPDGVLIGKVNVTAPGMSNGATKLEAATGYHDLFVVFKNPKAGQKSLLYFGGVQLANK